MKHWQWAALVALVAGSLVAEQLVHHEHHYWFTDIPGFFIVFGRSLLSPCLLPL